MTLRAMVTQATLLGSLKGERCARAALGVGITLLLDFGELAPPDQRGYREPERSLVSETCWRLEAPDRVVVGSGDSDRAIADGVQELVGRYVVDVEFFAPSYMARVDFDGELSLWMFPDDSTAYAASAEYPSAPWYLAGRAIPNNWES